MADDVWCLVSGVGGILGTTHTRRESVCYMARGEGGGSGRAQTRTIFIFRSPFLYFLCIFYRDDGVVEEGGKERG